MANPTNLQIFGKSDGDVNNVMNLLGLPPSTDARTAAASILDLLARNYKVLENAGTPLTAFTIVEDFENADLTTQNQTFTITFERAISVGGVVDERA